MKPSSDNLIKLFNNKVNFSTSISTCYNTDFILYPPNSGLEIDISPKLVIVNPRKLRFPGLPTELLALLTWSFNF